MTQSSPAWPRQPPQSLQRGCAAAVRHTLDRRSVRAHLHRPRTEGRAALTLSNTGKLPDGVSADTTYFVQEVQEANTFTISASLSRSAQAIAACGSQSGTHTLFAGATANAGLIVPEGNPSDEAAIGLIANVFSRNACDAIRAHADCMTCARLGRPVDREAGWWTGLDSNQRTLARADLQSAAFNHSATCPPECRKRADPLDYQPRKRAGPAERPPNGEAALACQWRDWHRALQETWRDTVRRRACADALGGCAVAAGRGGQRRAMFDSGVAMPWKLR